MINLNVHSGYDFLSSSIKLEDLMNKISSDNQAAVAITDRNRMHAHYSFMTLALKHNVKPIIGMEVSIQDGIDTYEMITYAKNEQGYRALIRISAYFTFRGVDAMPREVFKDMLEECIVVFTTDESLSLISELKIDQDDMYQSHLLHADLPKLFIQPSYYLDADDRSVLHVLHAIRDNTRVDVRDLFTYQEKTMFAYLMI